MQQTTTRLRVVRSLVPLAAAAGVAACQPANVVRLAPSPSPDSLIFLINGTSSPTAAATLVYGLSVVRCTSELPVWTISADGSRPMPDRVVYGSLVPGFRIINPPQPLSPGCYRVMLSRANPVTFDVSATGQVIARATAP